MNETILVPLDGSKTGEAALPYVMDLVSKLAPGVKAEVILLQVLPSMTPHTVGGTAGVEIPYSLQQVEESEKKAIEYLTVTGEILKSKGATVTTKVAVGDASEEIVKAAEEANVNIIAMSTHGRSGFSRWAFGSVTDRVLRREANIPITMVRAPR
jgi:nucleotide-binding universal stress UspA family protein